MNHWCPWLVLLYNSGLPNDTDTVHVWPCIINQICLWITDAPGWCYCTTRVCLTTLTQSMCDPVMYRFVCESLMPLAGVTVQSWSLFYRTLSQQQRQTYRKMGSGKNGNIQLDRQIDWDRQTYPPPNLAAPDLQQIQTVGRTDTQTDGQTDRQTHPPVDLFYQFVGHAVSQFQVYSHVVAIIYVLVHGVYNRLDGTTCGHKIKVKGSLVIYMRAFNVLVLTRLINWLYARGSAKYDAHICQIYIYCMCSFEVKMNQNLLSGKE